MDEVFFSSALPAHGSLAHEDSSLALPAAADSRDRSLRVQQQVQLTLARRARKTWSNGSVHLQNNTGKSFDATDGPAAHMKINGSGITNGSVPRSHARRPSKRVEVTPPPSPQLPRSRLYNGTYRFGTFTHPGPSLSQRPGPLPDQSLGGFDSFRRYTLSEAPRALRPHASTSMLGSMRQRSLRQAAVPQAVVASAAFQQQSSNFKSSWSQQKTVVKQEKHTVQSKCAKTVVSGSQHDEGMAWLAHLREETQGPSLLKSYPPSVVSMDMDMGKQRESPTQLIQTKDVAALKSANKPPEMTLERAVSLLTQENEETLISAAGFIQSQCFKSAEAKKMIYYLRGIGKLLQLLNNGDEEVQRVAAGALRNIVYQSDENKMEVKENDGIADVLGVLKSSRDLETRRELAGLLWNLSSHDLLKERLSREGLSILTKSVLVPCSGLSEGENPKDELLADADIFYNATGCLRNLSSAGPDGRKAMRECENLIDSLVYYIRGTIADYKTDDKSTENCACILHNLSYQIEAELPQKYARDLRESRQNLAPKTQPIGCFAYRSANITEQLERQCPLLEEKANPSGIEWLWSAITIRMYLSLIARSVRHQTQEAAIGALQNITAGKGAVTEAISFTIVQRENGLQHIRNMLEEGESDVKRVAISLIRNLSRYPELHPDIVKQVLPDVLEMLPYDDSGADVPVEVTASLCHILINLSQSDVQNVKAIINRRALPKIMEISSQDNGHGPTRAGQAACVLLQTLWRYNELHGAYKKFGYRKSDFINARTTKAVNAGRE